MGVFSRFVENTPMLFRTEINPRKIEFKISHSSKIISIGSCFADCMAVRFQDLEFDIFSNPFGILYNPISIFDNIENCISNKLVDKNLIIESRGMYFHYQLHSAIFGASSNDLLEKMGAIQKETKPKIGESNFLIITLGTEIVYFLKERNDAIANCYKVTEKYFDKKILTVSEIVMSFSNFYQTLISHNPSIRVILTVSPVRHIKDTLELNAVSKSTLRLSCHEITKQFSENVSYFPAYEIMMDDLRDYRFYKEDLIHPNIQAEEYIWEKFENSYFTEETKKINQEIREITTALNHRPFHPFTKEHRSFLDKTVEKIINLNAKINVSRLSEKMALKLKTER